MLRVSFTTPDGQAHQATLSSTWLLAPGSGLDQYGEATDRLSYRDLTLASANQFWGALGCEVTSVEKIGSVYSEL